jgi:phosphoribosyl 1,2-cyclic phosphate phosphodiesterase
LPVRFIFLGTGTSSGIPAIGCSCRVCTSPDPRDARLRAAAALLFTDPKGQERVILLDAGPDLRQQALRARLTRCDAVFFTHNHVDHIFGLDELRRFNATMNAPIDIYADQHTLESLQRVYKHIFERQSNINDSFVATLLSHRIRPGVPIDLYGLRITPFTVLHGKAEIVAYRIDSAPSGSGARSLPDTPLPLAYCTDTSGIPTDSWQYLRNLRTLVLDALRHRKHPTHFTIGQATSIAHEVGADKTYFIHMTHDLPHAQTEDELPENIHLAYDGLVLGASEPAEKHEPDVIT